jgi:hypothetical protein
MVDAILFAVMSVVLLAVGFVTRPESAAIPRGTWCNGVKPDGRYELRRQPADFDRGDDPPGVLTGRAYCTGGQLAIRVNERTIGCQHSR